MVSDRAAVDVAVAAAVHCRGAGHGVVGEPVAVGAQREISGRGVGRAPADAVMDVCLAGVLSGLPRTGAVSVLLWAQSHGGRDRGVSVGAAGQGGAGLGHDGREPRDGECLVGGRGVFF